MPFPFLIGAVIATAVVGGAAYALTRDDDGGSSNVYDDTEKKRAEKRAEIERIQDDIKQTTLNLLTNNDVTKVHSSYSVVGDTIDVDNVRSLLKSLKGEDNKGLKFIESFYDSNSFNYSYKSSYKDCLANIVRVQKDCESEANAVIALTDLMEQMQKLGDDAAALLEESESFVSRRNRISAA